MHKATSLIAGLPLRPSPSLSSSSSCLSLRSSFASIKNYRSFATAAPSQSSLNEDYTLQLKQDLFARSASRDLAFSLAILKACTWSPVVEVGARLLNAVPVMQKVAEPFVRHTFYKQFCALDLHDIERYRQTTLQGASIKLIPDYSVEDTFLPKLWEKNADDRIRLLQDAKRILKENVRFVPVKITSLGSPTLLEQMTSLIVHHQHHNTQSELSWLKGHTYLKSPAYLRPAIPGKEPQPLSSEQEKNLEELLQRLGHICEKSEEHDIKILVDAEQTSRQPAINHICRLLAERYNTKKPLVYNTFQLYLQGNHDIVHAEIEDARKRNYFFAAKVVRGAYMFSEREKAEKDRYVSPVLPSKERTDEEYDTTIKLLLENINDTAVCIASHNAASAQKALRIMQERGISKTHERVDFAQLRGIADSLTLALYNKGVRVSKLVPYGPVENVLPYLLRRVQENSTIFGGAQADRDLMYRELTSRFGMK